MKRRRRNPLKSGQCFLLPLSYNKINVYLYSSQSPQIGSMFLTKRKVFPIWEVRGINVAIPSNRVNVSYLGLIK